MDKWDKRFMELAETVAGWSRMAVQLITGMRIRCIMCRNGRWKIFWFRMFENLGGHRAWPSFCILGRRFLI